MLCIARQYFDQMLLACLHALSMWPDTGVFDAHVPEVMSHPVISCAK